MGQVVVKRTSDLLGLFRPRGRRVSGMAMTAVFSFPHPVNEIAARTVAAGVVIMAVCALAFRQYWLLIPLAYGFIARVLTGPKLSPLGQIATKVVAPRLQDRTRLVPGPPKRFAQAIGATLTVAALVLYFGFAAIGAAQVLLGMLVIAASSNRRSRSASAATSSRC